MNFPIPEHIILGNQFIGIEIFSFEDEEGVALLKIEKKKKELLISEWEKRSNIAEINKKIARDIPVFLIVNNKIVIQKTFEGTEPNDLKLLYRLFPNIKIDEFYYEIWRQDNQIAVVMARKTEIEKIVADFTVLDITFYGISLGITSLSSIIPFTTNTILSTNTQKISWGETADFLVAKEKVSIEKFEINGLQVQSSYLMAFAAALRTYFNTSNNSGNIVAYNATVANDFLQKSFFSKSIKLMIVVLLSILLLNFFAFNYYFKKANLSESNMASSKDLVEKIKVLKIHLAGKEKKLKNLNADYSAKISFYINETTKHLPQSMLLSGLIYQPLEKEIKEDEKIIVTPQTIVITGKTLNNKDFTNWIEALERYTWMDKVTITHFGKNETDESVFTVKLKLENHATP
jgi:Tfp pilus assembly protein PilN